MPESIKEEKRAFRKALRRRIAALTEKELEKSDAGIYNNLSSLPELLEARDLPLPARWLALRLLEGDAGKALAAIEAQVKDCL